MGIHLYEFKTFNDTTTSLLTHGTAGVVTLKLMRGCWPASIPAGGYLHCDSIYQIIKLIDICSLLFFIPLTTSEASVGT